MKAMHILYHFRTQGVGAEGVHVAGVSGAFRELGHEVTFSSPTGVDPTKSGGGDPYAKKAGNGAASIWGPLARHAPRILFETMELGYNGVALARNLQLIRHHHVDVIYERHAYFGCLTALLARWARLPLVVEVNELVGDERVRGEPVLASIALSTDRMVFAQADLIVVVSPHLKRLLVDRGVDAQKIVVQPNGVALRDVKTAADPGAVRQRHHLSDALVVGFVGFFVKWHRLDWLIGWRSDWFDRRRPGRSGRVHLRVREGLLVSLARPARVRELPHHEPAVRRVAQERPSPHRDLCGMPSAPRGPREVGGKGRARLSSLGRVHAAELQGADRDHAEGP